MKTTVWAGQFILAFLALGFFASCTHDPFSPIEADPGNGNPQDTMSTDTQQGIPCDPNVVYFSSQILPLLKSNCAKSGCHDAQSHEEGIILDSYQNLMNSGIVKANKPANSKLYKVITDSDPGDRMPEPPNQPLSADQIALIAKWIQQGAQDLTCDVNAGICDTTGITYSGFVKPTMATYCTGCHSGGSPGAGLSFTSFPVVQTVALNGRLLGAVTHAQGFSPMPQGSAALSSCTIEKFKAWISNGAQNN